MLMQASIGPTLTAAWLNSKTKVWGLVKALQEQSNDKNSKQLGVVTRHKAELQGIQAIFQLVKSQPMELQCNNPIQALIADL